MRIDNQPSTPLPDHPASLVLTAVKTDEGATATTRWSFDATDTAGRDRTVVEHRVAVAADDVGAHALVDHVGVNVSLDRLEVVAAASLDPSGDTTSRLSSRRLIVPSR
jgi:hypothetical protein